MKRIIWMGRTRADLKEFPDRVRRAVGHGLHGVQTGIIPAHAKIFKGVGNAKVWELRENDPSGTYRALYTIEFKDCVVVLHVFQKKSKTGIATPKLEIEMIMQRLKDARDLYKSGKL